MTRSQWHGCGVAAMLAVFALPGPAGAQASGPGFGAPPSEMRPDDVPFHHYDAAAEYRNGLVELKAGQFRDADRSFDNALSVRPRDVDTLLMSGEAKSALGDLKGSANAYQKAIKVDDQQITARREYAMILAKLGHADKAQVQLGILRSRSEACASACPDAANLKAAVAAVEAALSPPGPATPASR